jgi:hypothetical protein
MGQRLSKEQSIAELVDNSLFQGIHYMWLGGINCHVPNENG